MLSLRQLPKIANRTCPLHGVKEGFSLYKLDRLNAWLVFFSWPVATWILLSRKCIVIGVGRKEGSVFSFDRRILGELFFRTWCKLVFHSHIRSCRQERIFVSRLSILSSFMRIWWHFCGRVQVSLGDFFGAVVGPHFDQMTGPLSRAKTNWLQSWREPQHVTVAKWEKGKK